MDSNDDEEEDFPTAEFNNPVWSEEPIPNRHQLCIHQLLCHSITGHTLRPATPPLQPSLRRRLQEAEPMDISIMDDLPDVIDAVKEPSSDFDSWAHSVLRHQW